VESKTLTQILADVRFASDTQGLTDRHSDADLTLAVNASIRSLRGLVTARGFPYFLSATSATALAGTQVSDEQYSSVPWPPTALQIHGIDVETATGGGDWRPLRPITWGQRRDRPGLYPSTTGVPEEFAVLSLPQGSGPSTTAGSIALFPAGSSGNYKIWFLSQFTDLTASDVFLALPDWHEWIVQDVVERLAERDDDQHETYTIAHQRKLEAETRIFESVPRVIAAGPLRPRRGGTRRRWSL
jgi:hypothetical protein